MVYHYSFYGIWSTAILVNKSLEHYTLQTALPLHTARGSLGMGHTSNARRGFAFHLWPTIRASGLCTGQFRKVRRGSDLVYSVLLQDSLPCPKTISAKNQAGGLRVLGPGLGHLTLLVDNFREIPDEIRTLSSLSLLKAPCLVHGLSPQNLGGWV